MNFFQFLCQYKNYFETVKVIKSNKTFFKTSYIQESYGTNQQYNKVCYILKLH